MKEKYTGINIFQKENLFIMTKEKISQNRCHWGFHQNIMHLTISVIFKKEILVKATFLQLDIVASFYVKSTHI